MKNGKEDHTGFGLGHDALIRGDGKAWIIDV
jgi:hypothetical protein